MAVYFMQAGDCGPIKIGFTKNVARRRLQVQAHSAVEITVLGVMPKGTLVSEAALHDQFAHCRVRGEWFDPHPDLIATARCYANWRPRSPTAIGRYLQDCGLTARAFGALCGRSTATISRLARGLHKPDWATMEAIEKATGGKVQPNDWATATPAEPASEAPSQDAAD